MDVPHGEEVYSVNSGYRREHSDPLAPGRKRLLFFLGSVAALGAIDRLYPDYPAFPAHTVAVDDFPEDSLAFEEPTPEFPAGSIHFKDLPDGEIALGLVVLIPTSADTVPVRFPTPEDADRNLSFSGNPYGMFSKKGILPAVRSKVTSVRKAGNTMTIEASSFGVSGAKTYTLEEMGDLCLRLTNGETVEFEVETALGTVKCKITPAKVERKEGETVAVKEGA